VVARTEYLDAGHVVQFYGQDEELADRVADYLLGALQDEGVAVVIATAAHRRAFEGRLTQAGVDLAAAVRSGTYLALDADDTVDALMADGRLDGEAFDRVVGGLIRRAEQRAGKVRGQKAERRPVRAYGEMVAVLWNAGLVNAAVELEEWWDALGQRHSFSLFCSYPASSVTGGGHLEAFAKVCRLHRSVVGGWPPPASPAASASSALPAASAASAAPAASAASAAPAATRAFAFSGDAPAAARHFAVDVVRRLGAADLADDAALVVTELAANAIVHAQTGFTVDLQADPGVLRVSVRDASPLPGGAAVAGLPAAPLHGLGAVDALARRWGVEPLGHSGKSVWVELSR
jgi:hypothetical protein